MLLGATSFDDLCSKLLFYKQRLHYKKERTPSLHQSFVATSGNVSASRPPCQRNNHSKGGRGRGRGRDRGNNGGPPPSRPSVPQQLPSRSLPTGTALCDAIGSSFGTTCPHTSVSHQLSVGTTQSEGILGSHPNIVY